MTDLERNAARTLDAADPIALWRGRFHLPRTANAEPLVYLCGHSLGAQPVQAARYVEEVMRDWRELGVEGHFAAQRPWLSYHAALAAPLGRLVGALPHEVVAMNTLTVNLHLMLVSFYRPAGARTALLIEKHAFPSDRYAAESQVRWHGLDPVHDLIEIESRPGEDCLRTEDIIDRIQREGQRIATVMLPGVQYLTGQALDIPAITAAAQSQGCKVGWDLAHAIGNVPVSLHESGADFAVWCHYKYVNGGPGAVGGAFVHERHARSPDLPRLSGWWGNDPAERFRMAAQFTATAGADGWQLSNPPILAMAPLLASLEYFDAVGLKQLRDKSVQLTGFLEALLRRHLNDRVQVVTPADPAQRGAALSLRLRLSRDQARTVFVGLQRRGVLTDWREPDVIRVAPVPFYNSFEDVWQFVAALDAELAGTGA
jgi:kynureninase